MEFWWWIQIWKTVIIYYVQCFMFAFVQIYFNVNLSRTIIETNSSYISSAWCNFFIGIFTYAHANPAALMHFSLCTFLDAQVYPGLFISQVCKQFVGRHECIMYRFVVNVTCICFLSIFTNNIIQHTNYGKTLHKNCFTVLQCFNIYFLIFLTLLILPEH